MASFLDRERSVAGPGFNRWLIPPAALAIHLCIGQAYATSVYKTALVKNFSSNNTRVGIVFSIAIVMLGLSAAVRGTWVDRVGPRKAMFTAACFWGAGFLVGALGIETKQLWLLYLGYGVIGGIGLGIGYISPVSTLIKWFPDKPGVATGLAIMGFGGGALIATPASQQLMSMFDSNYNPAVATSIPIGSAVAKLFVVMGIGYFIIMMYGVFNIRVPANDWRPAGWDPSMLKSKTLVTTNSVSAANAIKTPQFYFLWIVLFCNVTAGIGILEQAAPMIQDFFRDAGQTNSAVTVAEAGGFVGMLSLANMLGRIVWSSTSDKIGRKPMYMFYLGVGILAYLLLATVGNNATVIFVLLAMLILSFYGGGFATVPAYLRDLFGTFQVGAIHGRLLTAWSAAGVLGPLMVNAIADSRIAAGVTGPGRYTTSFMIMIGLLVVAFACNELIKPVGSRFQEPASGVEPASGERKEAAA
jgi:MFS family permease